MTPERFKWIVECVDFDRLTEWEISFLESCERRVQAGKELSDRQEEILERLYREKA